MDLPSARERPRFDLSLRRIEVWCIEIAAPPAWVAQFKSLLNPDETARAERFHFEADRAAFVVTRGVLRTLLGRYTGGDPRDIRLVYSPRGKPALPESALEFNLSHTDGIAVFAFTEGCPLGVDVERIRPLPDLMAIARQFFSPAEADQLDALPEEDRTRAFFRCWTRKESYVKATGLGLAAPLREFQVTLAPGEVARFVAIGSDRSTALEWSLHDIAISKQYAAALSYRDAVREASQSCLLQAEEIESASRQ